MPASLLVGLQRALWGFTHHDVTLILFSRDNGTMYLYNIQYLYKSESTKHLEVVFTFTYQDECVCV